MRTAIRVVVLFLVVMLVLTIKVQGPAAGLHLLNHWASNVKGWWDGWGSSHGQH